MNRKATRRERLMRKWERFRFRIGWLTPKQKELKRQVAESLIKIPLFYNNLGKQKCGDCGEFCNPKELVMRRPAWGNYWIIKQCKKCYRAECIMPAGA
mgnify:CR=1 FL=1